MSDASIPPSDAESAASPADTQPVGGAFEGPLDIRSVSLTVLALLAVFYTLYFARDLFQPLALALLLSFLLSPVVRMLKRVYVPQILGSALTIAVLLTGISFGIYRLSEPAAEWADQASQSLSEIAWKLRPITKPMQNVQKATKEVEKKLSDITEGDGGDGISQSEAQPVTIQEASLGEILFVETREFILAAVTVIIFLFLLLASGDLLLRKVVRTLPRLKEKKTAVNIMRRIEGDISTYLITITLINIGVGATIALGMAVMGLPNPLLWGAMAALLNYIPYLGAVAGIAAVGFVALLTYEHVASIIFPTSFYLVVNVIEAYILTPLIVGRRLTLNPIIIFVSLLLWGWIWGIGGALMAVPILAVVKIVCDRLEPLAFVGELLGD